MYVNYKSIVNFEGRNGYFKQGGLAIQELGDGKVALFPLTSKGDIARCMIEIPVDDLETVINTLEAVKNDMRAGRSKEHRELRYRRNTI
jgi:hypothetical protein